jgi:hypothetical protein
MQHLYSFAPKLAFAALHEEKGTRDNLEPGRALEDTTTTLQGGAPIAPRLNCKAFSFVMAKPRAAWVT